ncbi:serine/threonine protein kinase [Actinoplanes sp. SE50]|uniref:serine/threonine-protein kinase n=1 Tax=unclassified Actinoplanes TaxID=2626549 RepID=UPI00023ECF8E|nr:MULTISPECIES: serine/threonine-protein kinase [unclassified Actinoplanes]AEV81064.1 serine/threonine protein kinase, bacterial [Actinoplanes sp. SE50/110]ATO79465.1 serine/threonine protein kinase [Actinoplanes sp. SE50]SLL96865.1 serine/threonine protein kinase [Actinoplanes sp. SE50/110]
MIRPGVTLGGRYRLEERIAGGGMGDVWRGTDDVLGRTVAVKILLPALLDEPGFAERFRGEARTMATINHPGVVDVYDYGSDQQLAFLVMEYVEGDALSRTLSRVGRLTPARTMALVAQAADALQAAHANGIVHRDVKPGNLLVRPNGTLVLTDFGIARSALVGQLTVAGAVLGTASYISPEQAAGDVATPASDVYALGVVAYQCLSGHRPFDGATPIEIAMKHVRETPRPLPGDIPPAVRAIVERALSKDPAARWPSAAAMAAVARQAAASLTTTVQPPMNHHQPVRATSSGPAPQARASVPRPISGARGAASVPSSVPPVQSVPPVPSVPPVQSAPPVPTPMPPHYRPPSGPPVSNYPQQPMRMTKPEGAFGRQVLIVLAVVLALLVLLCAGVISFLYRHGISAAAAENALGDRSSSAAILRMGVADDRVSTASYRLMKAGPQLGLIRPNEGRQTL